MKLAEIRKTFLKFFESKGHTIIPSTSLIPDNDSTLLFTNSGMVQFKNVFLGVEKRDYVRAATVQRCLRAGGKHNDLENVGYTARHHTFFEMLGNWSFGSYFKRESLQWAWELLTIVYNLPPEKLWVTVYLTDDETYNIWIKEIGLSKKRIIRIGDNKGTVYNSDNFWQMAETGPCGPCSEIFYDHGPNIFGGPPNSSEARGDRYVEIWNNVFMQFNRQIDPLTNTPRLLPLPIPCVDTGMGLERLAAILQNVKSNYQIDLFQSLIKAAARVTNTYDLAHNSLKVIADHIRAAAFLIIDGIIPGNEGRSYVLRRIIRRALRHGHKLGKAEPFFYKLVNDLIIEMGMAYPELQRLKTYIEQILKKEEERFNETLDRGIKILEIAFQKNHKKLDGNTAFLLYDTYGFPLDLTLDICRERNIELDKITFKVAMEKQKLIARNNDKFKITTMINYHGEKNYFVGYNTLIQNAKIISLYVHDKIVNEISENEDAIVILNVTPFYSESGGQIGDIGILESNSNVFSVTNTRKITTEVFGHYGKIITGKLKIGDSVTAKVDIKQRINIMRNHSATHLMHKALHVILDDKIIQKGSLIDANKMRFDFNYHRPVTQKEILHIEEFVNAEILANTATQTKIMNFNEALNLGAMALFNEKYSEKVRVLSIGSSLELCGGTHVIRTGDIGLFKITAESSIASGIRRIEAVTGTVALTLMQTLNNHINAATIIVKTNKENLIEKITQIQNNIKTLEKQVSKLKLQLAISQSEKLLSNTININGIQVLTPILENFDIMILREIIDKLKIELKTAIIVLVTIKEKKICLLAGVTKNITTKIKANELVNFIAQQIGGKGGGRSDIAQAGGTNLHALEKALKSVNNWVACKTTNYKCIKT